MKRSCCSTDHNEKIEYQKVYCGTCKSIANQYGHKARMLLNYDAVFLGEILGEISGQNNEMNSISMFRCFDVPKEHEIPENLSFASHVNVLFTSLKSIDALYDEGGLLVKAFHHIMKKEASIAFDYFNNLGISKAYFLNMLNVQNQREMLKGDLMFYAEPTKRLTSLIFALGAENVGRKDLTPKFSKLGTTFGELIYLLDAYQDFDKDIKKKQFNAFRKVWGMEKEQELMEEVILKTLKSVEASIIEIPLDSKTKNNFVSRLYMNVNGALSKKSCKTSISEDKVSEAKKIRLGIRWNAVASIIAIMIISTQGLWGQGIHLVSKNSKVESFHLSYWLISILGVGWLGLLIYVFRKRKIYRQIKNYRLANFNDPDPKKKKKKKSALDILAIVCGSCFALCGLCCAIQLNSCKNDCADGCDGDCCSNCDINCCEICCD